MPFKTQYGSHYHMTQGCHGADIPCDTNGLEPCSDCCDGASGDGGAAAVAGGAAAASADAGEGTFTAPEGSGLVPSLAAADTLSDGIAERLPVVSPGDTVSTGMQQAPSLPISAEELEDAPDYEEEAEAQRAPAPPKTNPIVEHLGPLSEERKQEIKEAMLEHFGTFMRKYVDNILRKKGTKDDIVERKRSNHFLVALMPDETGIVYSALSRSFDSALGKALETFGQKCASQVYDTSAGNTIVAPLTDEQNRRADFLAQSYYDHASSPDRDDYEGSELSGAAPEGKARRHETDNRWFDEETKTHYIIELKAGGDLDNKKARSEKAELLREYFMQSNIAKEGESVRIFFATAYNKDGDDTEWKQGSVQRVFADEEILIGRDYWNLVCKASDGYETILVYLRGPVGDQCRKEFRRVFDAYGMSVG